MKTKDTIVIDFGNRVRKERIKQGLSQEELAEKAEVHRNYIGLVERAERDPALSYIAKIARGLNISIKKLID